MLRQRLLVVVLLLPPGLLSIILGGWWYFAVLMLFFTLAAFEYAQMMQKGGHRPALPLVVGSVVVLALTQCLPLLFPAIEAPPEWLGSGALVLALAMVTLWHSVDYERGAPNAATDWTVSIAGIVYLGWMSGYFMFLRALTDGLYWTLIVLGTIWLADSGAYVFGKRWGKTLMAPRLSPKKTWAGFWGGIASGIAFGALFGWILGISAGAGTQVTWLSGAVVGLTASVTGVLGDLGISMLKRETGIKDTSNLLGAHGGLLDRIDSWLIAGPVCYFVIVILFNR
jgi:phosphatidate cytidylyltransferase